MRRASWFGVNKCNCGVECRGVCVCSPEPASIEIEIKSGIYTLDRITKGQPIYEAHIEIEECDATWPGFDPGFGTLSQCDRLWIHADYSGPDDENCPSFVTVTVGFYDSSQHSAPPNECGFNAQCVLILYPVDKGFDPTSPCFERCCSCVRLIGEGFWSGDQQAPQCWENHFELEDTTQSPGTGDNDNPIARISLTGELSCCTVCRDDPSVTLELGWFDPNTGFKPSGVVLVLDRVAPCRYRETFPIAQCISNEGNQVTEITIEYYEEPGGVAEAPYPPYEVGDSIRPRIYRKYGKEAPTLGQLYEPFGGLVCRPTCEDPGGFLELAVSGDIYVEGECGYTLFGDKIVPAGDPALGDFFHVVGRVQQ